MKSISSQSQLSTSLQTHPHSQGSALEQSFYSRNCDQMHYETNKCYSEKLAKGSRFVWERKHGELIWIVENVCPQGCGVLANVFNSIIMGFFGDARLIRTILDQNATRVLLKVLSFRRSPGLQSQRARQCFTYGKHAQQDIDRAREHNPYQANRSRLPWKTKDKQFKLNKQTELIGRWSAQPVQR